MTSLASKRSRVMKLATTFDEVAIPLELAGLMTSKNLALTLWKHIPTYLKKGVFAEMTRLDKKRERDAEPLVDKDDLITIAREEERRLLHFEAKMRGAGRSLILVVGKIPEKCMLRLVLRDGCKHAKCISYKY